MECADVHVNTGIPGLVERHKDNVRRRDTGQNIRANQAGQLRNSKRWAGSSSHFNTQFGNYTTGGGHLRKMVFFAAVCILDGFQQFMVGGKAFLNLENDIMLCMTYMSS